jgi:hypothetical protein
MTYEPPYDGIDMSDDEVYFFRSGSGYGHPNGTDTRLAVEF